MPYEIIKSETLFRGLLVEVRQDIIQLPNGKEAVREIVKHSPAAAVLPVDADGKLILVRQYRHTIKDMALEIPAGILEKGEDPAVGAARELEEEIGKKAGKLTFIFKFYPSIGFCEETLSVFIAEDLVSTCQNLDEDEFVTIERYTPEEVVKLISDGKIVDSKTIAAVYYYLGNRE